MSGSPAEGWWSSLVLLYYDVGDNYVFSDDNDIIYEDNRRKPVKRGTVISHPSPVVIRSCQMSRVSWLPGGSSWGLCNHVWEENRSEIRSFAFPFIYHRNTQPVSSWELVCKDVASVWLENVSTITLGTLCLCLWCVKSIGWPHVVLMGKVISRLPRVIIYEVCRFKMSKYRRCFMTLMICLFLCFRNVTVLNEARHVNLGGKIPRSAAPLVKSLSETVICYFPATPASLVVFITTNLCSQSLRCDGWFQC